MTKRTILTFVHHYLPGFKSGGPVRTISNMVEHLGREFRFKIITADRDFRDSRSFSAVRIGSWNRIGNADVFYCPPETQSLGGFYELLSKTDYDILYLNSFFNPTFTIKPLVLRKMNLVPAKTTILAPRGELAPDALNLKRHKKQVYSRIASSLDLYRGILWHASSGSEAADIQRFFAGAKTHIAVAPNLPDAISACTDIRKQVGELRVVYVGRIARIKNLGFAIKVLSQVKSAVSFDIFGPVDDSRYWKLCRQLMSDLPSNVTAVYRGEMNHAEIIKSLPNYHLFFLTTSSENFGHAIFEALSAGVPVLIGNNTPWKDLESAGVGWDLPLEQTERYVAALDKCGGMAWSEYAKLRGRARDYARRFLSEGLIDSNRRLFLSA